MGCGKYSTEFFFSVTVLGGWRSLGCHGYLQGKAPLLRYRPFHLRGTRSQAHLVDEFNFRYLISAKALLVKKKIIQFAGNLF